MERVTSYPHMCRDGHEEIGHADSEHEQCPLCRALGEIAHLEARIQYQRELIAADEARLRAAEARVGDVTWGCDAPDHFADEIIALRARLARRRARA